MDILKSCQMVLIKCSDSRGRLPRLEQDSKAHHLGTCMQFAKFSEFYFSFPVNKTWIVWMVIVWLQDLTLVAKVLWN